MKSGNTIPTVITDKNGKITTVHKKPVGSVRKKRIPSAPSLKTVTSQKEKDVILSGLKELKDRNSNPRFADEQMEEIATRVVSFNDPKLAPAVIGLITADFDEMDAFSVYTHLVNFRITSDYSGFITAYENLDLISDGSGRVESLFDLDASLRFLFGYNEPASLAHVREHYAAKMTYPHEVKTQHNSKYEENRAYMTAVQMRPELIPEMIEMVSHIDGGDATRSLPFEVLFGVHDEMPQEKDKFKHLIQEHGVSDLIGFMKNRGIESFNRDVVSAYFYTHGAVNDGLL